MKHSISKRIVALLCTIMLFFVLVLFIFIRLGVNWGITNFYGREGRLAVATVAAVMENTTEDETAFLQKLCNDNKLTYVYVFEPVNEHQVIYRALVAGEDVDNEEEQKIIIGEPKNANLSSVEMSIWHGLVETAEVEKDNEYGHVYTYLQGVYDDSGQCVAIAGVDIYTSLVVKKSNMLIGISILFVVGIFVLTMAVTIAILRDQVFVPIKKIKQHMEEFVSEDSLDFSELPVDGEDELSVIAASFNNVKRDIKNYIETVERLNKEKEAEQAELHIAARIQKEMLPKETSGDGMLGIRAYMKPAKTIGGDFYNYVDLGDHKYALVIADVSGKGMSAALFMARAITLLNENLNHELDPVKILENINNRLVAGNEQALFVTMFLAIYDAKTRCLTYANAGHNVPYLIKEGAIVVMKGESGCALGLFEDEEYSSEVREVYPSEILYLYTDGVNEAINEKKEFFGEDRLEEILAMADSTSADALVGDVIAALDTFTGKANQHDDITMLAVGFKQEWKLTLASNLSELEKIKKIVVGNDYIKEELQKKIYLAIEELYVNVIEYAKAKEITFVLQTYDEDVWIRLIDDGTPYNPLEEVHAPEDDDDDLNIGGFGKFLAFSIMRDHNYCYENGKNQLVLSTYYQK